MEFDSFRPGFTFVGSTICLPFFHRRFSTPGLLGAPNPGNQVICKRLKTFGVPVGYRRPIPSHVRLSKKVNHVLLPLFPVLGLQQVVPYVVLVDFLVERETQVAEVMQL